MSQLTKKAIKTSFIKLLNQTAFDKITVKDIVKDCGVNRNTFYYHYQDVYDCFGRSFLRRPGKSGLPACMIIIHGRKRSWRQTAFVRQNKKAAVSSL